jgi:hypothetical protein
MNISIVIIFIFIVIAFIYVENIYEDLENTVPDSIHTPKNIIENTQPNGYPSLYTTTIDRPYEISSK